VTISLNSLEIFCTSVMLLGIRVFTSYTHLLLVYLHRIHKCLEELQLYKHFNLIFLFRHVFVGINW